MGKGLTPANAGKTWAKPLWERRRWAHPRERGENALFFCHLILILGSPPRTRGKRLYPCYCTHGHGLTPANAGKTVGDIPSPDTHAAHPRERGENLDAAQVRSIRAATADLAAGTAALPSGEVYLVYE